MQDVHVRQYVTKVTSVIRAEQGTIGKLLTDLSDYLFSAGLQGVFPGFGLRKWSMLSEGYGTQ